MQMIDSKKKTKSLYRNALFVTVSDVVTRKSRSSTIKCNAFMSPLLCNILVFIQGFIAKILFFLLILAVLGITKAI